MYLDEDTEHRSLVAALRARGVDVLSASEADMLGRTDEEHLAYAAAQGRVICTFNRGHFYRLHTRYLTEGKSHAGVIRAPQQRYSVGEYLRRLLRLIATRSAEEMRDQVEFLSAWG